MRNALLLVATIGPAIVLTALLIEPRWGIAALLIFFIVLAVVGIADDRQR